MVQSSLSGTIKEQALQQFNTDGKRFSLNLDAHLIAFLCLTQVLIFGPYLSQVGFYLDDWLMLQTLRFGPQDWPSAFANYFLTDPKVIIRPVEVLHFAPMYFLFGLKPLGYHVVNLVLEAVAAGLLYFNLKNFSGSRLMAFLAALLFIAYPIRDCTHYWILCSSVSLSSALYLVSLTCTLKAAQADNKGLYLWSALPFALSIFNYEVFLPFAVISSLMVFLFEKRRSSWSQSLKQAAFSFLPLFAAGVFLLVYQRFIVPFIGLGFLHNVSLEPSRVLQVIAKSIYVSSPINALPFVAEQVSLRLSEPLSWFFSISLAMIFAGTSILSFRLLKEEANSLSASRVLEFTFVALATIVSSLAIFGLAKEFEPTLMTLINRMFNGCAVGWGCLFAAAAASTVMLLSKRPVLSSVVSTILSFGIAAGIVCFTLADWQMAQPWVVSQRVQKNVQFVLRNLRDSIQGDDAIILADCARYVMWSPVFDGVWDFQSMVRIVLGDKGRRAGVASDRLIPQEDEVKDVSVGYTCGSYPYKDIKVFVPGLSKLIAIHTKAQFVDTIDRHQGSSQLSTGTIAKWRKLLDRSGTAEK